MCPQYVDAMGLSAVDYAEEFFDSVVPSDDIKICVIVLGHFGEDYAWIHFTSPGDGFFEDMDLWLYAADLRATTLKVHFEDIVLAAKERWPEARIFRIPGCLYEDGVESLYDERVIEY